MFLRYDTCVIARYDAITQVYKQCSRCLLHGIAHSRYGLFLLSWYKKQKIKTKGMLPPVSPSSRLATIVGRVYADLMVLLTLYRMRLLAMMKLIKSF